MLEVCLLGTGGMMPLPYRWLTAMMARYNGSSILVDCGEGTQIALREKGWSANPIDIICFTHYHADHISGLPGMLLTMGNAERTQPLKLIGPKGLIRTVNALRVIAPELPFEIICTEITETEQVLSFDGFRIEAFKVNHSVPCYGYSIVIDRIGRFHPEKALEFGVEKRDWGKLQKGESILIGDRTITPDMVLGSPRKGLKVTYCTDTRPTDSIVKNADKADLFICEGMYGEQENLEKAKGFKHMTFQEAAHLAKQADVKELWLTHYSPALTRAEDFMKDVRNIFPAAYAGKDGKTVDLCFEEE